MWLWSLCVCVCIMNSNGFQWNWFNAADEENHWQNEWMQMVVSPQGDSKQLYWGSLLKQVKNLLHKQCKIWITCQICSLYCRLSGQPDEEFYWGLFAATVNIWSVFTLIMSHLGYLVPGLNLTCLVLGCSRKCQRLLLWQSEHTLIFVLVLLCVCIYVVF